MYMPEWQRPLSDLSEHSDPVIFLFPKMQQSLIVTNANPEDGLKGAESRIF